MPESWPWNHSFIHAYIILYLYFFPGDVFIVTGKRINHTIITCYKIQPFICLKGLFAIRTGASEFPIDYSSHPALKQDVIQGAVKEWPCLGYGSDGNMAHGWRQSTSYNKTVANELL